MAELSATQNDIEQKSSVPEVVGTMLRGSSVEGISGWEIEKGRKFTENTWYELQAQSIQVRVGPDYKKNNKKSPSASPIYDVAFVDVYTCKTKVSRIGRKVTLPASLQSRGDLPLPPCILLNMMIPAYAPKNPVWGKEQFDGDGQSVVFYLALSEGAAAELERDPKEWSPALRLLKRFVSGDATPTLKGIMRVCNLKECDLAAPTRKLCKEYNGTPFLMKNTTTVDSQPGYFEIDVDVHRWGYMARMGLHGVNKNIQDLVFDMCFVIQGDADDELPERLLSCARIAHVQLKKAIAAPDSFYVDSP